MIERILWPATVSRYGRDAGPVCRALAPIARTLGIIVLSVLYYFPPQRNSSLDVGLGEAIDRARENESGTRHVFARNQTWFRRRLN